MSDAPTPAHGLGSEPCLARRAVPVPRQICHLRARLPPGPGRLPMDRPSGRRNLREARRQRRRGRGARAVHTYAAGTWMMSDDVQCRDGQVGPALDGCVFSPSWSSMPRCGYSNLKSGPGRRPAGTSVVFIASAVRPVLLMAQLIR